MMIATPDPLDSAPSDDDLVYLRAALKPFDPVDRPRSVDTRPHLLDPGAATSSRPLRPRAGLLVAAAAAVAVVALTPAVIFTQDSRPVPLADAAQAFADCSERTAAADDVTADVETGPAAGETDVVTPRWYTAAKAVQLSAAVRNALPAETCVFPGSATGNLRFNVGDTNGFFTTETYPTFNPGAEGRLVTPNGDGTLMVGVYPAPAGSESCVVGEVDQQVTTADGTIVSQTNGAAWDDTTRWIVLMAQAYRPDGSCVWLRVSDEILRQDTDPGREGMTASGAAPLTMDDLTALAAAPGLTAAG